jgi:hypothetical protein
VNLCRTCGFDFASVEAFDAHRVGAPARGRRCLPAGELRAKGWSLDARGRWSDPARSGRLRRWLDAREAVSDVGIRRRTAGEASARLELPTGSHEREAASA